MVASWTGEAHAFYLRGLARIIGLALLFSLIVEVGQYFVETRHSSIVDVSSYLLGALIGWVLWIRFVRPKVS